ncbi:phosphatase PAP2 family protein [Corynebacterium sp. TAE3-ERU12]|uniref:phosphatase PAP2 family protein n=1 Tax=Corynebacterium sp. TAE3-ERU12 TaxID=2849491 RepID=UPI001C441B07|nr:phosphatase PAP2 family protein [Corynebacterium sp. TAE3-ERU12]MBV7296070.1 phosphatase PAP2 family protein [Corynebacterium sp. TAE3-ERU12]
MSSTIKGDPFHESDVLVAIQQALTDVPGVLPGARAMSLFGEHAAGWLLTTGIGWAVTSGEDRQKWGSAGVAVFGSHAASVVLKRIVRRPRPHDPRIVIGVATPSTLSFPSSHATSTTAALVAISRITGSRAPLLGVPAIMVSRLVLGVHYPTDVAAGAALGIASAAIAENIRTR